MARDISFENVFEGCARGSPVTTLPWSFVPCNVLTFDFVCADCILACVSFSCATCCGLVCPCNTFALTSVGFATADFRGGREAGAVGRSGTGATFFTEMAREIPSVLLRCTTGRFAGGVDGNPNSSSEGTSKTSGLVVAARAVSGGCTDFLNTPDPAGASLESAVCLCGRSGEGASSSSKLRRGGGRRDNLPYVTFFRFSPVVKVDDMNDAIFDAFAGVVVMQRLL